MQRSKVISGRSFGALVLVLGPVVGLVAGCGDTGGGSSGGVGGGGGGVAAMPDMAALPPDMLVVGHGAYPSGPYGKNVGQTLADMVSKGYRLSPEQTNS